MKFGQLPVPLSPYPQPKRSSGSEELLPPAWLLPVSSVPFLWFRPWYDPWRFPMPPHRYALLCSRLLCKSYSWCYPPLGGNDRCPESFSAAYSRMCRILTCESPRGLRPSGWPVSVLFLLDTALWYILIFQGSELAFECIDTDVAEGLYR